MTIATAPGWGQRLGRWCCCCWWWLVASTWWWSGGWPPATVFMQNVWNSSRGRLEQLERMAANREPIQQLITRIQQDRNITAQYLPQSAPPLAAAELQQRVKAVVEAAGGPCAVRRRCRRSRKEAP